MNTETETELKLELLLATINAVDSNILEIYFIEYFVIKLIWDGKYLAPKTIQ